MTKHSLRWAARLHIAIAAARTLLTRDTNGRHTIRRDAGYTTETVIVTALLVAAALTVVGIIVARVVAKANSITF